MCGFTRGTTNKYQIHKKKEKEKEKEKETETETETETERLLPLIGPSVKGLDPITLCPSVCLLRASIR